MIKKLLLALIAVGGAFALWRKITADRAELDLWAQSTDSVSSGV